MSKAVNQKVWSGGKGERVPRQQKGVSRLRDACASSLRSSVLFSFSSSSVSADNKSMRTGSQGWNSKASECLLGG